MSSLKSEKEIIHREFELERVILFSDAVFAIAITLLIIDVKFPEMPEKLEGVDYWHLFKPTIIHFLGLCVSFFFIGMFWSRHLKMFKYLQDYNQGLIVRNLFFLFFIVIFPFAAEAMTGHVQPGFVIPFFIYFSNIALCSLMHLWLCHYIFYKKTYLSVKGYDNYKKYIFLGSKYSTIMLLIILLVAVVINIFFPGDMVALGYGFYVFPFIALYARKRLKKYKPVEDIV